MYAIFKLFRRKHRGGGNRDRFKDFQVVNKFSFFVGFPNRLGI